MLRVTVILPSTVTRSPEVVGLGLGTPLPNLTFVFMSVNVVAPLAWWLVLLVVNEIVPSHVPVGVPVWVAVQPPVGTVPCAMYATLCVLHLCEVLGWFGLPLPGWAAAGTATASAPAATTIPELCTCPHLSSCRLCALHTPHYAGAAPGLGATRAANQPPTARATCGFPGVVAVTATPASLCDGRLGA